MPPSHGCAIRPCRERCHLVAGMALPGTATGAGREGFRGMIQKVFRVVALRERETPNRRPRTGATRACFLARGDYYRGFAGGT
jgi:hypothetical protein